MFLTLRWVCDCLAEKIEWHAIFGTIFIITSYKLVNSALSSYEQFSCSETGDRRGQSHG